jgi:hypothetical protein
VSEWVQERLTKYQSAKGEVLRDLMGRLARLDVKSTWKSPDQCGEGFQERF